MSILFIGNDIRQRAAKDFLVANEANALSLTSETSKSESVKRISASEAIVLPLPTSSKDLTDILDHINGSALILGGKLSPSSKKMLTERSIRYADYYENESFQIKNAKLTAEGAIYTAIELSRRSISGSKIAVIGFGRIGKLLALDLHHLGAEVTVCARKASDLAWIECFGYNALQIAYINGASTLSELCNEQDIIFNTVPSWVFDETTASKLGKRSLIIDLASSPFGIDQLLVKKYDLNYRIASSLPAKCVPESAGELVGKTVLEILKREGIGL